MRTGGAKRLTAAVLTMSLHIYSRLSPVAYLPLTRLQKCVLRTLDAAYCLSRVEPCVSEAVDALSRKHTSMFKHQGV